MENVGIFYGQLEYLTAYWYTLRSFRNVLIIWYIFRHFGILCQEESGIPDSKLNDLRSVAHNKFCTYLLGCKFSYRCMKLDTPLHTELLIQVNK
jgi:hypothetical protein